MNHRVTTSEENETLIKTLEELGQYRVLRRVPRVSSTVRPVSGKDKVAILLDTETTGLDASDEIVEIAMISVAYDEGTQLIGPISQFEALQQPSKPLTADAARITGITNSELRGRQIDHVALTAFVEKADIIIAHNASFDRPKCEKLDPIFSQKPWACSATGVDWKAFGYESSRLKYLLLESGYFYDPHRAMGDCNALLQLLQIRLGDQSAFTKIVESARLPTYRVQVRGRFETAAPLRARGYRWRQAGGGQTGYWQTTLPPHMIEQELATLKAQDSNGTEVTAEKLTAFERFRD
ncbi:DNA polymerase III subunit epsilon [Mesorhizobium sp. 113-3-9]|uniref:3'-5' exonuclease n=1 Tax=Mesorhizobium sp. 113-3-9 TaxID=2744517 RepID=UPI001926F75E|nr:3'-5' exonuclease [Mesorhizobium sp. 113-3-9]BCG85942.1 DNA polymerase III subunit epsilon [Mesorhizobium sp. 113-3-9]